jgi:transposase
VRDLTRLRTKKVQARTSDVQRLGKTLESAGIKLGSVASEITGKGPAAMIEALIDGERRGAVMADLAVGRARARMADLALALEGRFTDHHAMMCRLHLDAIALHDAGIAGLDARIAARAAPWRRETDLLKTIPGFGDQVAWTWIAEIGPAPARVVRLRRQARLLGRPGAGQLRQRRQAGIRPHRPGRNLRQARAGPGRLGRGQVTRAAAGPLQPPGPPHGR